MTDEEALIALQAKDGNDGYIDWNTLKDQPFWWPLEEPRITLDGSFSAEELRAILHFLP